MVENVGGFVGNFMYKVKKPLLNPPRWHLLLVEGMCLLEKGFCLYQ